MNKHLNLSLILGLNLLLFSQTLSAQENETTNPLGCLDTGYEFRRKTLNLLAGEHGPKQTMYFIYNFGDSPIALYQMRSDDSARSMYINHTIQPHHWSVIAVNENILRFICSVPNKKSNFGEVVDCAETLKVCNNAQVRFGLNNKGNFWIVGNSSKNEALRQVVHYGIIP